MMHTSMLWVLCTLITSLSCNTLSEAEYCKFSSGEYHCKKLLRSTASELNIPDDACFKTDCTGCLTRWRSFLVHDLELVEPRSFYVKQEPKKGGRTNILDCVRDGFECTCSMDEPCSGTTKYCAHFPCDVNSTCFCKAHAAEQQLVHVEAERQIINPDRLSYLHCVHKYQTLNITHARHKRSRRRLLEQENAKFEQNGLSIVYNEPVMTTNAPGTLIVRVNGLERIYQMKADKLQVSLPEEFLRYKSSLIFIFVSIEGKTLRGEVQIEGRVSCRRSNCLLCMEMFHHLECLPASVTYLYISILIIFTSVAIIYIRQVLKLLWTLFYSTFMVSRQIYRILRGISRTSLVAGATVGRRIRGMTNHLDEFVNRNAQENLPPSLSSLVMLAILALAIPAEADCTNHMILQADNKYCTDLATEVQCKIQTHAQVTLENLDYQQCLWFEDSAKKSLFRLKIKLNEVKCSWRTTRLYYTYFVDWRMLSQLSCPQNDQCGWLAHCRRGKDFSSLTPESLSYPGFHTCMAGDSGATGCYIVTSQSCIFYRVYLVPDYLRAYEIRSLVGYDCSYSIFIEEHHNSTIERINVRTQTSTKSGIKIQILGAYDQPSQITSLQLISRVGSAKESYLDSASPVGRPEAGKIGDVQANSSISKDFLFDESMFSCYLLENRVDCQRKGSYLEQLVESKVNALPKTIGYHHMQIDAEGRLTSTLLRTSPVVVALTFHDYKFTIETQTVCPKFSDTEAVASGCYACATLARLEFKAFSTCKPGTVSVNFELINIATRSVYLLTEEKSMIIEFYSESKCVQDKICLQGQTAQSCKLVSFCLDEGEIILNHPNVTYLSSQSASISSPGGFWDWISLTNMTQVAGLFKVGFLIFLMLTVSIFFVSTFITSCCR